MKLETHITPKTITAIYEHYIESRKNGHRPHLGGSQIGHHCDRALWYQFRHAWSPSFPGRILRLFETGDLEEIRIVRNLRDVGVEVWEIDPETGEQINFTDHGGHFGLSLDGIGKGFQESKVPHVLEFKTANTKSFKKMKAEGLEKANPQYWSQVQIGMHYAGLTRAFFFMTCKETDDIHGERVHYDKAAALKLVARAEHVIFTNTPPAKIAETDDWWQCKFCDYRFVCQRGAIPEVNCRTCAHSTPEKEGGWSCAVDGGMETCKRHLFRPDMMPGEVVDAGDDWVEYDDGIRNQGNSLELFDAD